MYDPGVFKYYYGSDYNLDSFPSLDSEDSALHLLFECTASPCNYTLLSLSKGSTVPGPQRPVRSSHWGQRVPGSTKKYGPAHPGIRRHTHTRGFFCFVLFFAHTHNLHEYFLLPSCNPPLWSQTVHWLPWAADTKRLIVLIWILHFLIFGLNSAQGQMGRYYINKTIKDACIKIELRMQNKGGYKD